MRKSSRSWNRDFSLGRLLIWLILTLVFLVVAYPFFYVLSLSVMPYEEYVKRPIHIGPAGFTLAYFIQIVRDPRLSHAFLISILKTSIGTPLSLVATMMAGFALSRRELRYGRILSILFLIPLFVSPGLIPYFLLIKATGMLNTFLVLVIPRLVAPFYLFMVKAHFAEYPSEVIEAAIVDGAGKLAIFWRIVWPTSKPIIMTIALLYGVSHWNEYFWPSILVQNDLHPATVVLQGIVNTRKMIQGLGEGLPMTPQSFTAAVAAILIIPVLIVYPFVQRHVVKGMMVGSIKG